MNIEETQAPLTQELAERPFYFVSYSTGEPQIGFLVECLEIVFGRHFELKQTPSALESGRSQHDVILDLLENLLSELFASMAFAPMWSSSTAR